VKRSAPARPWRPFVTPDRPIPEAWSETLEPQRGFANGQEQSWRRAGARPISAGKSLGWLAEAQTQGGRHGRDNARALGLELVVPAPDHSIRRRAVAAVLQRGRAGLGRHPVLLLVSDALGDHRCGAHRDRLFRHRTLGGFADAVVGWPRPARRRAEDTKS